MTLNPPATIPIYFRPVEFYSESSSAVKSYRKTPSALEHFLNVHMCLRYRFESGRVVCTWAKVGVGSRLELKKPVEDHSNEEGD